jgi:histone-lysine N-methyltransferase SETMAR
MESSKDGYRFYIFTRSKLGIKATAIHEELVAVFGESAPSFDTVARWIRHFSDGRSSLEDEQRSGRPCTSLSRDIVARAEALIHEDPSVTLRFLSLELGISYGSAHTIMHDHLKRSKKCARWVPHQLSEEQKNQRVQMCQEWLAMFEPNGPKRLSDVVTGDECWISFFTMKDKRSNMVWLSEDEPRPEVLKTGFRSRKRMFTMFFNTQGPVAVDIMPEQSTITARYYTETVLPKVLQHVNNNAPSRRRTRLLLHHDNASPHKAVITREFLHANGVHLLQHPPYSPDLAPCDFWLFPRVKSEIAGRPFHRVQDLAKAVHSVLETITTSEYHGCFQSWRTRMQRCINAGGSYFEGM